MLSDNIPGSLQNGIWPKLPGGHCDEDGVGGKYMLGGGVGGRYSLSGDRFCEAEERTQLGYCPVYPEKKI